MSDFKLKIIIGDAQIELEGEGELVHTMFQELKESGLGNISPLVHTKAQSVQNCEVSKSSSNESTTALLAEEPAVVGEASDFELPPLNSVVMQGLPQKESEWMLIYALYASNCGKGVFSKEDLRAKYEESNRVTQSHSNHFIENLRTLLSLKYISAVSQTDYRMEQTGIQKARTILSGTSEGQNGQKSRRASRKRNPQKYLFLELNLSEAERTQFKKFWNGHKHTSNIDKAVLTAYWLKAKKNIEGFTPDHLFTMLRTIEEGASFDLLAAITNAKKDRNYFSLGSAPKTYNLTHIGEDHVKQLEIHGEEDK